MKKRRQELYLIRSLLFVPGNRADMMEKARDLPADALVLDLEDSVPPQEKERARETVSAYISRMFKKGRPVLVRINPFLSGLTDEDLSAVLVPGLGGISLPKVEEDVDLVNLSLKMDWLEEERGIEKGSIGILPWIESPRALCNAYAIASSSTRVLGLAFGADDYTLNMGIQRSREGEELAYPRQVIAVDARAAGVLPLDTPYVDYKDREGLVRDCKRAKQAGFAGKFAIHPSQIEIINEVFSPTPQEIEEARHIIAAFEEALSRGSAVTSLEGRMIDTPVAERARRLLIMAEGKLTT